ncbi:uncharacterized protein FA14DRAFT_159752 [Meira miltonrushii]|uniref:HAD-superfamily phosphatase n=1 Tax=Meira miltonrushii TaxID=1280837 RepID=A0A316VL14_9BASI|nr:uncharacterized protein FA14DRAFT_159752 [Meira miltonrushii]PWN37954.1 hypothetical protein FA14DRAFT_159752 [Meira miltonrushii]
MGNSAGVWAVLASFARPGLVVPHLIVNDIGDVDWNKLHKEGKVDHIIIDKDNCITLPLRDQIAPGLETAWSSLTNADFKSILIVSNSAGSSDDPLAIGAEQLARKLGQRVLAHPHKKPAMGCAKQVVDVLSSEGEDVGNIAVVGDRITTDIVLANRINKVLKRRKINSQSIGVLTTGVLEPERLATRTMRGMEMWILDRLMRIGIVPGATWFTKKSPESLERWSNVIRIQDDAPAVAELNAEQEAAEQRPMNPEIPPMSLVDRVRNLPNAATVGIMTMSGKAINFLGQGWHLINDGIRIGTKGQIGGTLSDVTLPRNRHIALEKLSKRPYPSSPEHNPFTSPRIPSLKEKIDEIRTDRIGKRQYSTRAKPPPSPVQPGKPRPRLHTAAYFAALILLPTCWFGGMALHEYLDMKREMREAGSGDLKDGVLPRAPPIAGGIPNAQSVPSLVNAKPVPSLNEQNKTSSAQHETLLLRTERLHLSRQLDDIDEKLTRIRERRRPSQNTPDVRAAGSG